MTKPWTAETREYARRLAVEQVCEGQTIREAAEFVGASMRSVKRWVGMWRRDGDAGLVAGRSPGAPRKLLPEQESQVLGWLETLPSDFGFPTERWTLARVQQVIQRKFDVSYHRNHLAWLLDQLDWSVQQPLPRAAERDEDVIRAWLTGDWPRIKKGAAAWRRRSVLR